MRLSVPSDVCLCVFVCRCGCLFVGLFILRVCRCVLMLVGPMCSFVHLFPRLFDGRFACLFVCLFVFVPFVPLYVRWFARLSFRL